MVKRQGSLIFLPKKGKALIITDLHGNLEDYNRYMDLWNENKDYHLIITGDFIHGMNREPDNSIEILESLIANQHPKIHILLGNHEWATLAKTYIYKAGSDQTLNFKNTLKKRFKEEWDNKLEEYSKFFNDLAIAVRTDNGVFISHAGPPKNIKDIEEIIHIKDDGYVDNNRLFDILWTRYYDLTARELENFLKAVDCQAMIVGHTPVDGVKVVYNNLLVVSSSYSKGKKAYVDLDLENNIKNGRDLKKMVKYLK